MSPVDNADSGRVRRPARRGRCSVRMDHAAERGVTAVAHMSVPWRDLGAYLRAKEAGTLTPARRSISRSRTGARSRTPSRSSAAGDDWVWIGGVKGYVDGSLGSTTALFYSPYNDDPSTTGRARRRPRIHCGAWIGAADSAGLQVVVHAIGERANGLLLDIYDSVARAHGQRDRRFRIEHAQHLRRQDIDRFAAARRDRLHAAIPRRSTTAAGRRSGSGPSGSRRPMPSARCSTAGAHLAFGSDWTVAPIDPLLGIYAAVTRRTLDGKNPGGWVPRGEDHASRKRCGPTRRATPTACSPKTGGASWRRATWPTWCCWIRI